MAGAEHDVSPDVFTYLDYREYLRDYYELKKASVHLSYRVFARRANLTSPNYLKLVIDGQRNLTDKTARRFAKACGLTGPTQTFFLALVRFCQARIQEEREAHYRKLVRLTPRHSAQQLSEGQDSYHSRWYYPAVRELVGLKGFKEDPQWVARHIVPNVTPSQAKDALRVLQELGLLVRKRGKLKQKEAVVSTGPDLIRSLHLRRYHKSMLQLAVTSMERLAADERDISALTLKLGPNGMKQLKERIQQFRTELIELAESTGNPSQVVHVGLQSFPVAHVEKEDA